MQPSTLTAFVFVAFSATLCETVMKPRWHGGDSLFSSAVSALSTSVAKLNVEQNVKLYSAPFENQKIYEGDGQKAPSNFEVFRVHIEELLLTYHGDYAATVQDIREHIVRAENYLKGNVLGKQQQPVAEQAEKIYRLLKELIDTENQYKNAVTTRDRYLITDSLHRLWAEKAEEYRTRCQSIKVQIETQIAQSNAILSGPQAVTTPAPQFGTLGSDRRNIQTIRNVLVVLHKLTEDLRLRFGRYKLQSVVAFVKAYMVFEETLINRINEGDRSISLLLMLKDFAQKFLEIQRALAEVQRKEFEAATTGNTTILSTHLVQVEASIQVILQQMPDMHAIPTILPGVGEDWAGTVNALVAVIKQIVIQGRGGSPDRYPDIRPVAPVPGQNPWLILSDIIQKIMRHFGNIPENNGPRPIYVATTPSSIIPFPTYAPSIFYPSDIQPPFWHCKGFCWQTVVIPPMYTQLPFTWTTVAPFVPNTVITTYTQIVEVPLSVSYRSRNGSPSGTVFGLVSMADSIYKLLQWIIGDFKANIRMEVKFEYITKLIEIVRITNNILDKVEAPCSISNSILCEAVSQFRAFYKNFYATIWRIRDEKLFASILNQVVRNYNSLVKLIESLSTDGNGAGGDTPSNSLQNVVDFRVLLWTVYKQINVYKIPVLNTIVHYFIEATNVLVNRIERGNQSVYLTVFMQRLLTVQFDLLKQLIQILNQQIQAAQEQTRHAVSSLGYKQWVGRIEVLRKEFRMKVQQIVINLQATAQKLNSDWNDLLNVISFALSNVAAGILVHVTDEDVKAARQKLQTYEITNNYPATGDVRVTLKEVAAFHRLILDFESNYARYNTSALSLLKQTLERAQVLLVYYLDKTVSYERLQQLMNNIAPLFVALERHVHRVSGNPPASNDAINLNVTYTGDFADAVFDKSFADDVPMNLISSHLIKKTSIMIQGNTLSVEAVGSSSSGYKQFDIGEGSVELSGPKPISILGV